MQSTKIKVSRYIYLHENLAHIHTIMHTNAIINSCINRVFYSQVYSINPSRVKPGKLYKQVGSTLVLEITCQLQSMVTKSLRQHQEVLKWKIISPPFAQSLLNIQKKHHFKKERNAPAVL